MHKGNHSNLLAQPGKPAQQAAPPTTPGSFPRPNHQPEADLLLKLRVVASQNQEVYTHPPLPVTMPSKHTVVVSLDAETEAIVKALGGNRSEWIRDAIKWRHGPGADLEVMEPWPTLASDN